MEHKRKPLRVLLVEDNAMDAELMLRELTRGGFEADAQRVESEAEYIRALDEHLDLILSDHTLPQFSGVRALVLLKESGLEIPFILVSGTIGEELAVTAMRLGAADYLLKDRLIRLGAAVVSALEQGRLRREHRRTVEALRESEERLQLASQVGNIGIFELNHLTGKAYVSPVLSEIAEIQRGQESDVLSVEQVLPEDRANFQLSLDRAHDPAGAGRLDHEYRIRLSDGGTRWLRVIAQTWFTGEGVARRPLRSLGTVHNITPRKSGEVALRESEERFRQLAENIREVFWMIDPANSQVLYVSPAYEEIWNRTCASLHANPNSRLDSVHPEDRERVKEAAVRKLTSGGYDEVYRIVRPDGAIRWIHDRAFPVKNASGEVYRVVGTAEDITERKQLEAQFLRAQRLEAIGTLSSGIAHDLNNILAPTMMVVSLLREKLSDPGDLEMLGMVEQGAQRGANIIKQLLTFSRGIGGDRGLVQIRHLIREMFVLMRETFPRDIKIVDDTPPDLPPVIADATQLSQVIMNLCVNARDAMPAGGKLTLSAQHTALSAADISIHAMAKPGSYVILSVADTGEGISPELVDRIFEPFFTTKEIGKGTGLGLSTVMGIAKSHGGFITVYSEPGRGTLFKVYLPATAAETAALPPSPSSRLPLGQKQLVLIVDDEPAIRQAIAQTLERNQYRVVTAADGREGLAMFLEHRSSIRLVLTDVMMPVMSGVSFIRTIRALEPNLRIVAMSGLNDDVRKEELTKLGVDKILWKPCGAEELLETLYRELQ